MVGRVYTDSEERTIKALHKVGRRLVYSCCALAAATSIYLGATRSVSSGVPLAGLVVGVVWGMGKSEKRWEEERQRRLSASGRSLDEIEALG